MANLRQTLGIALCTLCLAAGCSSEEPYTGPELIAVDGIVTLDTKPLADATLTFIPKGNTPGQGAVGQTDASGRFSLTGFAGHSGTPAGTYRVIITKRVMPDGATQPLADCGPMDSTARQILPECYSSFQHSKLSAEVISQTPLEFHLRTVVQRRW